MKGIIKEDFSSYVIEHKNISINWLTYGVNLQKVCSNCKLQIFNYIGRSLHSRFYYILEDQPYILQYISKHKSY
jgi:hypothetical protein